MTDLRPSSIFIIGYWTHRFGIINSIVGKKLITNDEKAKFLSHGMLKVETSLKMNAILYTNDRDGLNDRSQSQRIFSYMMDEICQRRKVIFFVALLLQNDGTFRNIGYDQNQMTFINQHIDGNSEKPFNVVVLLAKVKQFKIACVNFVDSFLSK